MSAEKGKGVSPIWLILFAALVLRAALPLYAAFWNQDSSVFHEVYSSQYLEPAQNLVKSGAFTSGGAPEIYRTPGYPMLLVTGILLQHVVPVTIALQILLSCLTVVLVFKIALLIFGSRQAATMCAWLYAAEPLSIIFSSYLLPETCLTFALSLCLYCFVRYVQDGSLRDLAFSALALVAAIYIHPLAYFLPLLLGLILMGGAIKHRGPAMIAHALAFLAICIGLIAPWQMRNYLRTGYCGFSTLFDQSLYYAQGASLLAERQGKPHFEEMWPEMAERVRAYGGQHPGISEGLSYMRYQGLRIIKDAPVEYAWIHVKGIARTLSGLASHGYIRVLGLSLGPEEDLHRILSAKAMAAEFERDHQGLNTAVILVTVLLGIFLAFIYVLSVVALFSRKLVTGMAMVSLLCVALYWLIITGGPHGYSRYRHAVMPIISVWAGYGLYFIVNRLKPGTGNNTDSALGSVH